MITTKHEPPRYLVHFTNGVQEALADAAPAKGGQGAGFGPHELLEASVATCINMWIRMQADKIGVDVAGTVVSVTLKRDDPEEAIFQYRIVFPASISAPQQTELLQMASACPVSKTLLKKLSFERIEEG